MAYARRRTYRSAPRRARSGYSRRAPVRRRTAGRRGVSRSGVRDIRIVIEQPGTSAARPPLGMVQAEPAAARKARF